MKSRKKIRLKIICDHPAERPRIDHRVLIALEELILNEILLPKKIIVNSSYDHKMILSISINNPVGEIDVLLENIQTRKHENAKKIYCTYYVPPNYALEGNQERNLEIFHVFSRIVDIYLAAKFKKYAAGTLLQLISERDFSFLLDYKFPALYEDQKLILDETPIQRKQYFDFFKSEKS